MVMVKFIEYKKKITVKKSFYFCLIALVFASGCATTQYSQRKLQAPLEGEWKSTALKTTISFKDEKVSGSDGCNSFSLGYKSDGERLEIDKDLASTMMNCEEEVMEKANAFRKNLAETRRYTNNGKILRFLGDDGVILDEFKSVSTFFDSGKYIVHSLSNEKKTILPIKAGVLIFIEIKDDGKMSGFTGCNRFSSNYLLNENNIAISKLITTRKMCPIDNKKAEKDFIEAMKNGAKLSYKNGIWELRGASDILLMNMVKE